jgi:hypothetical protein
MLININHIPSKLIKLLFSDYLNSGSETNIETNTFLISIYIFNILVSRIKYDSVLLNLDYDFFNKLSKFKKNIYFEGSIKNNTIHLNNIIQIKQKGTINLLARKKLFKLFNEYGINLTLENKTKCSDYVKYKINLTF